MKFIKYAVGLVIALSVIPMVVVAVTKLDEPRLKTIEFEVVDYDTETSQITFSDDVYTILSNVPKTIDETTKVTNVVNVKLNNIDLVGFRLRNDEYGFLLDDSTSDYWFIGESGAFNEGETPTLNDVWQMTFEVPNPTPPLIKLLVGFAPLLFIGGILLFMLNKRKLA